MTTYQPNIPTGLVKLNTDYKNIRDNFQQLDTSFGKDHVTFSSGTAQNGFHEDIHFNPFSTVATVPTPNNYDSATQYPVQGTIPPGAPPTVAGIGQLFSAQVNDSINADTGLYWLSGNGNKVALTRNFVPTRAANGYTFLPGGLILQWGSIATPASGAPVAGNLVTFPLTFPNNVFSITLGPSRANTTNEALTVNSTTVTTVGFNVITGSNNYARVYWQAIGY